MTKADLINEKPLRPGDRVTITDKDHPWHGERGRLESYGSYGLPMLNLQGWLINLDIGHRTYAKGKQVKP